MVLKDIFYPPEWSKQKCIWLSFPHNSSEWDQVDSKEPLKEIQDFYYKLINLILDYQDVSLLASKDFDRSKILEHKYELKLFDIENNDIWIRDYGPFFVQGETRILDFKFNAWGGKFPPWDLDDEVPLKLSERLSYKRKAVEFILEGGAVEFNGEGVLMTTKQCLLNPNRNPEFSQEEIEALLKKEFALKEIIWLERGLEGDHTDGHIDDFARFVSANKILLCQTDDTQNPNCKHLLDSKKHLEKLGYELEFLPLPQDMKREGEYLPASYANFIFLNGAVVMPLFNCPQDELALEVFERNFPDRKILTIDSSFLIQEGGGLHCMTKQEAFIELH